MPWKNNDSGGSGSGGPWGGSGNNGSGNNNPPPNRGQRPRNPWGGGKGPGGGPNFEDMLKRGQDNVKRFLPGGLGSPRGLIIAVLGAAAIWLVTGFYRVNPQEAGVEMLFGRMTNITQPGLHWNWPAPIGTVHKPLANTEQTTTVGYIGAVRGGQARSIERESLMLTGDENIIDIRAAVIWKIDIRPQTITVDGKQQQVSVGIRNYLFNSRAPDRTVKDAAEAVLRSIVGRSEFESIRTTGRAKIEADAATAIQDLLNRYGTGIQVLQVQLQNIDPPAKVLDSFRDVQAARADQERMRNDAQGYFNKTVQEAEGQAERIVREAEAYKQERINLAEGEASRFLAIYREYAQAKDVTRQRIYLDAMKDILRAMDKVLMDGRSSGAVPYLPLEPLRRAPGTAEQPQR